MSDNLGLKLESRRRFLGLAILSAIGTGVLLGDILTKAVFASISHGEESFEKFSLPPTTSVSNAGVSVLSVKVVYFQMPQYFGDEYFVLQAPAVLRDLLSVVMLKHPPLAPMMATMWILINGTPSKPDATLRDGDEVNFIPLVAGG
jgi:hypothetical protein